MGWGQCILTMSVSVIYVWVCVNVTVWVFTYRTSSSFIELLTAVTGAFPSWQECCFGENSVACVWRRLYQLVQELFCYNYREWCTRVCVHSQLMEMDQNGPFGFAQSDQCVCVCVCVCVHVCAEGRTRQWECIKENIVYKTSGVVVF